MIDGESGGAAGASSQDGRTASVVAAAPIGITNYDANGDCCRRRPRPRGGAATVDGMMTMAGGRGNKATAR
jgi:hypothetical protein